MLGRMGALPSWARWLRYLRHCRPVYRVLQQVRRRTRHAWLQLFRWILPARLEFGPPKGWFFIVEEVRAKERPGRIVVERQDAPRARPDSLRKLAGLGQDAQRTWPIFWSHHQNARLVGPTLVLLDERKRVGIESAYGPGFVLDDPAYGQFRRSAPITLQGSWTSVVSQWSAGFPHWFIDVLPRLAVLPEFPRDTRVLVPPEVNSYRRDTLAWLGLAERIRPTREDHLRIEHFFFSSPTNITGLFDPYAAAFCRRSFRPRADRSFASPKRFFVHRVNAVRGLVNEEEVLRFFQERGWPIIDTQALTMAQQIQLFANAEQVCALHGAALANLLWCQPGCRVLELVPSTFLNGVYEGLAEAVGVDYAFLLCKGHTDYKAFVDLHQLEKSLAS